MTALTNNHADPATFYCRFTVASGAGSTCADYSDFDPGGVGYRATVMVSSARAHLYYRDDTPNHFDPSLVPPGLTYTAADFIKFLPPLPEPRATAPVESATVGALQRVAPGVERQRPRFFGRSALRAALVMLCLALLGIGGAM